MPSPPSTQGAEARSSIPPTILIVDDEPSIATSLSLILEHHGYRSMVARTGEEAVQLARSTPPHALVCDVIMHEMNGIEAALQIRALCPECRIILMSGNANTTQLLEDARSAGHQFEVLAKPFHPTRLIKRLRSDADGAQGNG
ncbi:MAG TPA: response regulator [Tepidisphaeraceae bacterium]|nr:response regulator [Tepidisphaeraceae bacterium]